MITSLDLVVLKNFNLMSYLIKILLIKTLPDSRGSCVYTIHCKRCNKQYVGQTGKHLECRKTQQKYSLRTGQDANAFFVLHVRFNGHIILY